jgi:hypothetical protein
VLLWNPSSYLCCCSRCLRMQPCELWCGSCGVVAVVWCGSCGVVAVYSQACNSPYFGLCRKGYLNRLLKLGFCCIISCNLSIVQSFYIWIFVHVHPPTTLAAAC